MRTQAVLAAVLVLPLMLLQACNRADHSPTTAGTSQEKKPMAPSATDKPQESAPGAAGPMSAMPPAVPPADSTAPANPPNEPKKN